MPQAVPGPEKRNLSPLIQHALCRHQIGGFESFGEPIVDGRLQLARLLGSALLMLQPCKACGCSQLPRQGTLPARPIERVQKCSSAAVTACGAPSRRISSPLMRRSSAPRGVKNQAESLR
jgi:hypothetical protein